jgi:drug/metabolite transporter (DMT)-like permease
MEIEPIDAA